jgi:hypothetical protein
MAALRWEHTFEKVICTQSTAMGKGDEVVASMQAVADQYGAAGWELVSATMLPFPEDVNNLPTTLNAAARAIVLGFKRPV